MHIPHTLQDNILTHIYLGADNIVHVERLEMTVEISSCASDKLFLSCSPYR
jgi:hypothetical protein